MSTEIIMASKYKIFLFKLTTITVYPCLVSPVAIRQVVMVTPGKQKGKNSARSESYFFPTAEEKRLIKLHVPYTHIGYNCHTLKPKPEFTLFSTLSIQEIILPSLHGYNFMIHAA